MTWSQIIEKLLPLLVSCCVAALNFGVLWFRTRAKTLLKNINEQNGVIKRTAVEDPKGYYLTDDIIVIDENGVEHNLKNCNLERRNKNETK